MTSKLIITSGFTYVDIDAYACILAYKELLSLQGIDSTALIAGQQNDSITKTVKTWTTNFLTELVITPDDEFVIMDTSDTQYLSKSLNLNQIVEVYDHHFGYEDFWKQKLRKKAIIEHIGSCATLIWEEFKRLKHNLNISKISANLLYTAILSNTLNLKAQITDERDNAAFSELRKYIDLPNNWAKVYFDELAESINHDPVNAITNDTKVANINNIDYVIGQIELWDNADFIKQKLTVIMDQMKSYNNENWFFTSPNISQGFNYIICENTAVKDLLAAKIGAAFDGNIGKTNKLWLRKEIIRELAAI